MKMNLIEGKKQEGFKDLISKEKKKKWKYRSNL